MHKLSDRVMHKLSDRVMHKRAAELCTSELLSYAQASDRVMHKLCNQVTIAIKVSTS